MLDKRIIFLNDEGGVSVIRPTPLGALLSGGDVHKLARKDVPYGEKYAVVDESELPPRESRAGWVVDEKDLNDGVGFESNEFGGAS